MVVERGKQIAGLQAGVGLDRITKKKGEYMRGGKRKRGVDMRIGDGYAFCGCGASKVLADGGRRKAADFLWLLKESGEREGHERTKDASQTPEDGNWGSSRGLDKSCAQCSPRRNTDTSWDGLFNKPKPQYDSCFSSAQGLVG